MSNVQTLYERVGGEHAIESMVVGFYMRVMNDPEMEPFFRDVPMKRLHAMQREFFAMALGGPLSYGGRPLSYVHHGRGITTFHYSRFVEHLVDTIVDYGVSDADGEEVIDRINSFANEITGTSY